MMIIQAGGGGPQVGRPVHYVDTRPGPCSLCDSAISAARMLVNDGVFTLCRQCGAAEYRSFFVITILAKARGLTWRWN